MTYITYFIWIRILYLNTNLKILSKVDVTLDISVKNPPDCIILDNWGFENFILADEPFPKTLQIFETCVSVNKSLYGKLILSLEFPMKLVERFKVTSVLFFIPDLYSLSWELYNFTFKVLYQVILC